MNDHYVLTIKATDRPGLLHSITGIINRRLIPIVSVNAAPTDIHDIILITVELRISAKALAGLLLKLENIVEVFAAEATRYDEAISRRSVFFKLDQAILTSPQSDVISKWEAQFVSVQGGYVLIAASGSEQIIRRLYNELDGPYLVGFCQTGLIVDNCFLAGDESSVISKLAA